MNIDLINETKFYAQQFKKTDVCSQKCDGCPNLREDYEGDFSLHRGTNKFYECFGTSDDCPRVMCDVIDAIQRVKNTRLEDIGSDLSAWNDLNKQERLKLLEEMVEVELDA